MAEMKLSYNSTGQNPFDTWKIIFFTFPISVIIITLISISFGVSVLIGLLINIAIAAVITLGNTCRVQRTDDDMFFSDSYKSNTLTNVQSIETWWSYDFSSSSPVLSDGATGQTRAHANKVNIFAKFKSETSAIVIFEQIHLSDKFPNNHIYKPDESLLDLPIFKVWDVDKCLQKLKLGEFVNSKL